MEDGLNLNTKLFSFNGVIGRRDYLINSFIIGMISQLFTSPMFFGHMQSIDFNSSFFMQLNDPQRIILIISMLICIPISFSNMIRRLSDIWNKQADTQIYIIILIFFILSAVVMFLPLKDTGIFYLILFICGLFIMLKKGAVTGQYPVDPVKKFNWGAFWGTWLWGLFNKTFITLWEIPLLLTPVGFGFFPLLCGLKGNEWAYKNKQYSDVDYFHKTQKKQAIIFSVVIIVGFLITTVLVTGLSLKILDAYLSKPENKVKLEQKINNLIQNSASKYFTKIDITKEENKVYMNPVVWKNLDLKEKMNLYKFAYSYSMTKRGEIKDKVKPEEEMKRTTTIYSDYNNEVLARFKSEPANKNDGVIKKMKKSITDYHFNYNPKIPTKNIKQN